MADVKYTLSSMTLSLDQLRSTIHDETMRVILEGIVKTLEGYTANDVCPVHEEPPHITLAFPTIDQFHIQVTHCCQNFAERSTSPFEKPTERFQTAHFQPDLKLIIELQTLGHMFAFDADEISTLIIGRAEPDVDETPTINLYAYGAAEQGVSRKHASIVWWEGALHLMDNDSANGTYMDEKRLEPGKPYMLHDGDLVRLGNLVLNIRLLNSTVSDSV
jgi:hypothetical protein